MWQQKKKKRMVLKKNHKCKCKENNLYPAINPGINECRSDLMFCIFRFDFLIKVRDLSEVYICNSFWCIVCSILTLKIRMKFITHFLLHLWIINADIISDTKHILFILFFQPAYVHTYTYIYSLLYIKNSSTNSFTLQKIL